MLRLVVASRAFMQIIWLKAPHGERKVFSQNCIELFFSEVTIMKKVLLVKRDIITSYYETKYSHDLITHGYLLKGNYCKLSAMLVAQPTGISVETPCHITLLCVEE